MTRIVVHLQGGLVDSVETIDSDDEAVEVLVLDYDTEGADEDRIHTIHGGREEVYASQWRAEEAETSRATEYKALFAATAADVSDGESL